MRLLLMVPLVALSACMLGPYPDHIADYRPQTSTTAQVYYECLQGAQQPYAAAHFGAGGGAAYGNAVSSVGTNNKLVCACMGAHGYMLRRATGGEMVFDTILLPVEIPLVLLGAQGSLIDGACP